MAPSPSLASRQHGQNHDNRVRPVAQRQPRPATQTTSPPTARSVQDALGSVPSPAYTRAEDETQPVPGEWAASVRAETPEEKATAQEIRDLAKAMLATKG